MRLSFKFKNGDDFLLSEEETKSVIKQMNYFKLITYFSMSSGQKDKSFKVLDREIRARDLKSVEVHMGT